MKRILLPALIFLILISCKKKTDNTDNQGTCSGNSWTYIYITSPLENFFFKQGSYWVYKNDSTNSLDSITISKIETGCEPVYLYQEIGINWEYYQIYYYSNSTRSKYYDMIEGEAMIRNRHPSEYPSYYGWVLYTAVDSLRLPLPTKHIDTLNVEHHIFYNIQLSESPTGYGITDSSYLFTANGIGVIRKIIYNSTGKSTWNLIRWKIIK
jgi:hypothetical protein